MSDKQRKNNLDLLKVISMLMIIIFHYAFKGDIRFNINLDSQLQLVEIVNKIGIDLMYILGEMGTTCMMLISGYLMCDNTKVKIKKILILLLKIEFFYFFTKWIQVQIDSDARAALSAKTILFPIYRCEYWYLSVYILILIISPLINYIIKGIETRCMMLFFSITFVIYSVLPTVLGLYYRTYSENFLYFNRFIWMIFIYAIGAFVAINNKMFFINIRKVLRILFIFAFLLCCFVLCVESRQGWQETMADSLQVFFWTPNNIINFGMSFGLFMVFVNMNCREVKIIQKLSKCTLTCYLIHDINLAGVWWGVVFKQQRLYESWLLIPYAFLAAGFLLFIGYLCELLWKMIQNLCLYILDSLGIEFHVKDIEIIKERNQKIGDMS